MGFGRLAVVTWVLLLFAAVGATFLPTSPEGYTCGSWVDPEWGRESSDELVAEYEALADRAEGTPYEERAVAGAAGVRLAQRACDDALGTRRTVSLALLGAAVLVPTCVLFVGAGRREPGS